MSYANGEKFTGQMDPSAYNASCATHLTHIPLKEE